MLRKISEVPDEFTGWPEWFEWYELVDGDRVVAVAGLDWRSIPSGVGLHLEVKPGRWGKRALMLFAAALEWLKMEAKARGCLAIVGSSFNADQADKLFKFAEMFGFGDHHKMAFTYCRLRPDETILGG